MKNIISDKDQVQATYFDLFLPVVYVSGDADEGGGEPRGVALLQLATGKERRYLAPLQEAPGRQFNRIILSQKMAQYQPKRPLY